jgi:phosphopantetheinyl transferase
MANRYFSRDEQNWLAAQPPHDHDRAFFRLWTHKEAYLKAQGHGLGVPLDQFTIVPGQTRSNEYWIREFEPEADYQAVLIWAGKAKQIMPYAFLK